MAERNRGMIALGEIRRTLRGLYSGSSRRAIGFQIVRFIVDVAILVFFIAGPGLKNESLYAIINAAVAAIIAVELVASAIVASSLRNWIVRPMTWIDLIILATFLVPAFSNLFLRALRIWSLSKSNLFKLALRKTGYRHMEDTLRAGIDLVVFLFLLSSFVYTVFYGHGVDEYVQALYFTVATVTTTGFGDITLPGNLGKLTSIVAMIIGVSLFVRLAQAIVRPHKVNFSCPQCGLSRHEADAVHCKACGHVLNIPDDGE
jgi:voltage-gated potassium channel